ncbi:hypothetical protein BDA96_10G208800 [Sorghum bicolor]|uniref:Uncharacterized protein n=1 Tax=Sorghum bicolor TaxID=4558 RepID=A0A921Q386_SORBI|nr:hypothetical protein BDA96_10G208800 [Sorghum bicolor]
MSSMEPWRRRRPLIELKGATATRTNKASVAARKTKDRSAATAFSAVGRGHIPAAATTPSVAATAQCRSWRKQPPRRWFSIPYVFVFCLVGTWLQWQFNLSILGSSMHG